jgi:hypothetical protein
MNTRLLRIVVTTICAVGLCSVCAATTADLGIQLAGHWGGALLDVAVSGNRAYVAQGAIVRVFDISDPSTPLELGKTDVLPNTVLRLRVSGDRVYAACCEAGLQIIDVSNPAAPISVGGCETPDFADGVALSGGYAYMSDEGSGLRVIDVSDPSSPTTVGHWDFDAAEDVAVSGNYAYVAGNWAGLQVIDVSNPTNPVQVGQYAGPFAWSVAVSGRYAYQVGDRLTIIDVSNPAAPVAVGTYQDFVHFPNAIAVSGDRAYVANLDGSLDVLDVSDRTKPTRIGSLDITGEGDGVAVCGDCVYLADSDSLQAVDISDPANPVAEQTILRGGRVDGVALRGSQAYVVDGGLSVLDISNPSCPLEVGHCPLPTSWNARHVSVAGDCAFVSGDSGLQTVDVSAPANPTVLGAYYLPSGYGQGLAVLGGYAYLTDYYSMSVLDVSSPQSPTLLGSCGTTAGSFGIAVSGSHVYLGGNEGLWSVDIADPARPSILQRLQTGGYPYSVVVAGNHLYAADADYEGGRLMVLDVSNAAQMSQVGACAIPKDAERMVVSGDYAFIANGDAGLQIVDISNPASPRLLGGHSTSGYACDVVLAEGYAYVASGWSGLVVLKIPSQPSAKVTGVNPAVEMNTHCVHVEICGSGFLPGAGVTLTGAGQPDIVGTNVSVVSDTKITADIDLTGQALGFRNVVATNPDSLPGSLWDGFCVALPSSTHLVGMELSHLDDEVIATAASHFRFCLWGPIAMVDSDHFDFCTYSWLGPDTIVRVVAPGYLNVGFWDGCMVSVRGTLDLSSSPPILISSRSQVTPQ